MRTRTEVRTEMVPLDGLRSWRRTDERISHEDGGFFDVIGVRVRTRGREVAEWTQPMIEPHAKGVVAFLVRPIEGVLHVLVHARVEPGYVDIVELAPTVQCTPDSYERLPARARPLFLDEVLPARADRVRFDAELSEEGGRFYHARNRYLVAETDLAAGFDHPDFRWVTLAQLVELLRHSHYVNIQARSLVACLYGLATAPPRR
ncbi:NDP-hexose 2,3-dehydratase family protein [Streptomyces nogalater]